MSLQETIKKNTQNKNTKNIPVDDPYKANHRQCNGKCPCQKYQKIKK